MNVLIIQPYFTISMMDINHLKQKDIFIQRANLILLYRKQQMKKPNSY